MNGNLASAKTKQRAQFLFEVDCFQMTAELCHNRLRSMLNHYEHVAALGVPL